MAEFGRKRRERKLFVSTYLRMCLAAALIVLHTPAHASIGPGLGMGLFSVVVGVLGSIFLGILAVIWYPIKRVIRIFRSRSPRPPEDASPPSN